MTVLRALALLAVVSCGPAPSRPDVLEVKHEEDVMVGGGPALPNLGQDALNTPGTGSGLTQSLSSTLENQGVQKEEVRSVKLTQLRLEVVEPTRNGQPIQDLRFLDALSMKMSAPGQPEVLVAESAEGTFGQGVFAVDIPLKDAELKGHVTADSMTATTEVTANSAPAFSCTVRVTTVMKVQLDPVGAAASNAPFPSP